MTIEQKPAPEEEAYLLQRIRDALAKDPRTNELELEVQVAGTRITISGMVATPERRDGVSAVATEVAPDHEIHNWTDVPALDAPTEAEQLP